MTDPGKKMNMKWLVISILALVNMSCAVTPPLPKQVKWGHCLINHLTSFLLYHINLAMYASH